MAIGMKTGGRVAGTPNKVTSELRERLRANGADPLDFLANVVADKSIEMPLRIDAAKSLMPYTYPRLTSIDLAAAQQQPINIEIVRFGQSKINIPR